ncbi:hypothetical protein AALA22_00925 [Anaerovoracaceae bacterium 41-7]
MTQRIYKKMVSLLLIAILSLAIVTVLTAEDTFAATSYVTMAERASNYRGTVPVYKNTGTIQWTSSGQNGVLSRNVYVEYIETVGSYYKVKWGSSVGYVKTNQGTKVASLPAGTTKLSSAKKETHGVYSGYLAASTYVIYTDASAGKIKWATYCNDSLSYGDETKWIVPGIAKLSSL